MDNLGQGRIDQATSRKDLVKLCLRKASTRIGGLSPRAIRSCCKESSKNVDGEDHTTVEKGPQYTCDSNEDKGIGHQTYEAAMVKL